MSPSILVVSEHSLVTLTPKVRRDDARFYGIQVLTSFAVFGAILGTLDGRKVEVFNSFELVVSTTDDGSWVADEEYFTEKSEQC